MKMGRGRVKDEERDISIQVRGVLKIGRGRR